MCLKTLASRRSKVVSVTFALFCSLLFFYFLLILMSLSTSSCPYWSNKSCEFPSVSLHLNISLIRQPPFTKFVKILPYYVNISVRKRGWGVLIWPQSEIQKIYENVLIWKSSKTDPLIIMNVKQGRRRNPSTLSLFSRKYSISLPLDQARLTTEETWMSYPQTTHFYLFLPQI